MLLGAPKCGTTSVARTLSKHAEIAISKPKEPMFFESEFEFGMAYYKRKYFSHHTGESAIGDARAANFHLPYVTERIAEKLPDSKLIVILRNPTSRAFSHWWMRRSLGLENDEFCDALLKDLDAIQQGRHFEGAEGEKNWQDYLDENVDTASVYLEIGHYAEHIQRYLTYYDQSKLLVLFIEDLHSRPEYFYGEICSFLEIPPFQELPTKQRLNSASSVKGIKVQHQLQRVSQRLGLSGLMSADARKRIKGLIGSVGATPKLDAKSKEFLVDYYREHNLRLEQMFDCQLSHWNK